MMMLGLNFMNEVPFRHVYINGLVLDKHGKKMSKTKGNVVDPLELMDEFGSDALRFTLAALATHARDIKLATDRVKGYRNFGTKLWNAVRFTGLNGCVRVAGYDPKTARETLNRWALGEAERAVREVTAGIEAYRFSDAANAAYRFVWNIFCDWYVELSKPVLEGPDGPAKDETRATVAFLIDEIVKLLHPFMPFITEELWAVKGEEGPPRQSMLALASWPQPYGLDAADAEGEVGWVVDLVSEIRSVRTETNVPAGAQIPLALVNPSRDVRARAQSWGETIKRLARLSAIDFADQPPEGAVQLVVRGEVAALPLADLVDLAAERSRLKKDLAKLDGEIAKIDAKLNNESFMAKAREEAIDEQRERREEAVTRRIKLAEALKRLGAAA